MVHKFFVTFFVAAYISLKKKLAEIGDFVLIFNSISRHDFQNSSYFIQFENFRSKKIKRNSFQQLGRNHLMCVTLSKFETITFLWTSIPRELESKLCLRYI